MSVTVHSNQNRFNKIVYADISSQFTQDNQQLILTNIAAVNGEILNLILTQIGSRPFEPEFGSAVPDLLFEQPSMVNVWIMKNKLFEAIIRWMPYVHMDYRNSLIFPLQDAGGYYFRIVYSVAGMDADNIQVDFRFTS